MKEANPADYIPRARSETTYDEFRKRHPWLLRWECFKLAVSEWWCERWSKRVSEMSTISRRQFLRFGPAVPLIGSLLAKGLRVVPYSIGSHVGKWIAWIENSAGKCIGFISKTGSVFWMPRR